ncbi:dolichyl-phosphate-mannose-protein mannosyltransferase [Leptospira broomii serovar Hurstbridge str. 5399]|uniref:Dolichyl-phosphate-mannose-protein mannosyltransferase n=1 Tax=Leptospira broomii serovar Hurstbridge str. 5399 TaxID=1049789 RepID=T0GJK2_9LEPT|nr:glycosyltransferase family 39 protein [Leptospira broomii]EQA45538.1 dolichyl-phosphate-mannose-protein mannosyltransferase [Leptospira broomii serovar Hurstbridge str. 5399]
MKKNSIPFLFSIVFFVNVLLPVTPRSDTIWNVPTGMSIILHGDTNLDEFQDLRKEFTDYGLINLKGKEYNIFPIGVSILAIPQLFLMTQINGSKEILNHSIEAGKFVAAGWMALATVFIFLGFKKKFGYQKALYFAILFAFATPTLSTGGRAIWQQSGALLLNTMLMYILIRGIYGKKELLWIGLICGFAIWVRPTTLLVSIPTFFFLLLRERRKVVWVFVTAIPVFLLFMYYTFDIYESFLPAYYSNHSARIFRFEKFGEAFAGLLFSPNRGLFIWSPFLALSILGILRINKDQDSPISILFLICMALHLILLSSFDMWWGGHSIGPRLLTETIPFFLWFTLKGVLQLSEHIRSNKAVRTFWLIACLLSFIFHFRASADLGPTIWNRSPQSIDANPSRVWDWHDPQFLSGDHALKFIL